MFIEPGTKIHGASVRNEKCACLKVTFFCIGTMCNCISMYPISVFDKN